MEKRRRRKKKKEKKASWQAKELKAINRFIFYIQKVGSGDKRIPEFGSEPSTEERTLSAEDKGLSYTSIVSNFVYKT